MAINDDWSASLQNEFPFMLREHTEEGTIYQRWGFECAAGWYALLRDCCLRITEKYEQAGREIDFIPLQIKEKFGTLRFYYGFKDFPQSISAIDFLDGQSLRFSASNQQDDEEIALLRQAIDDIISETEEQSKQICEFCGEKGSLRTDLRWKKTLCDHCYNEQIQSFKLRQQNRKISQPEDYKD